MGGPNLLNHLNLTLPDRLRLHAGGERKGQTWCISFNISPWRPLALADVIRPESEQAVAGLQTMNVEVVMLTGDSQAVAQAVAD